MRTKPILSKTFLKQNDDFSCGPIAIANALIMMGEKTPSKRKINKLIKLCKTNEDGTFAEDLRIGIRACGYESVMFHNLSLAALWEIIGTTPIILGYMTLDMSRTTHDNAFVEAHFITLLAKKGDKVYIANGKHSDKYLNTSWITKDTLRKYMTPFKSSNEVVSFSDVIIIGERG